MSLASKERLSTGEWTLICRMCVSLPFWWLLITAIWIMKVRIGRSRMSIVGITTHSVGSWRSTTSTSWRSLKFVPARIETLKNKKSKLTFKYREGMPRVKNNTSEQFFKSMQLKTLFKKGQLIKPQIIFCFLLYQLFNSTFTNDKVKFSWVTRSNRWGISMTVSFSVQFRVLDSLLFPCIYPNTSI